MDTTWAVLALAASGAALTLFAATRLRPATPRQIERRTAALPERPRAMALREIGQVRDALGTVTVREVDRIVEKAWLETAAEEEADHG